MSGGEILYRVRQWAGANSEKVRLAHGWEPRSAHELRGDRLIVDAARLRSLRPDQIQSSHDSLIRGELTIFDYANLPVGRPINWHRDPLTGIDSPRAEFGKTIDYRDASRVGDIKVLWELGRHQFLVPMALEYFVGRDQSRLDVIGEVLESWFRQNRYGWGVHWCSSLEVAIRGLSWSMTHQFLMAAGLAGGIFSLKVDSHLLRKQIFQHASFIRRHLSLYSSANNHLVGELTGLHVLCSLFEFGVESNEWKAFAWKSLLAEAEKQVHADGVDREQAIYYHCWVLEYFLINYLVACHGGQTVPDEFSALLSKMGQFVHDLAPMDGDPPQIGDADDGVALQFGSKRTPYHWDLIETVNVVAGSSPRDGNSLKAFCYASLLEAGASPRLRPVDDCIYPRSYPEGGYAILGSPSFHVVFDCGNLGYPSIAAHGHADMLSMCLAMDGLWWIVDPGTYSYHSDLGWRSYFRGSRAHNVLVINGRDQSEMGGPFMWVRHARAHFDGLKVDGGDHVASGWHDGYAPLGVPHVKRTLRVNTAAKTITISDRVECNSAVDVGIHFHFAPEVHCLHLGEGAVVLGRQGSTDSLKMEAVRGLGIETFRGDAEHQLGWYSASLGKKEPCLTLRATATIAASTTFTVRLTVTGEPP